MLKLLLKHRESIPPVTLVLIFLVTLNHINASHVTLTKTFAYPKSLVDILKHKNLELLKEPDIELEIAKWMEKITLDKIPISDLVKLKVGPVLESFCELTKDNQMAQGLHLLAESALKKLKSLTFSSMFSKGINAKHKKANPEKPRLKLEVVIRRPKEKAKMASLQDESLSLSKQGAFLGALDTSPAECTEPILVSQKNVRSAPIISEMESVSMEHKNDVKIFPHDKVSSSENVEGGGL